VDHLYTDIILVVLLVASEALALQDLQVQQVLLEQQVLQETQAPLALQEEQVQQDHKDHLSMVYQE
jgi:hypothetical protein